MNNRTAVLYGAGDIRLAEQTVSAPDSDEILIKVGACGVCGSDLGAWRTGHYYPAGTVPGHEFGGTVVAVGDDVEGIPVGATVTVNPMVAFTGVGGAPGGFADYVLVMGAQAGINVHLLPASVSTEEAALIEPLSVSLHGVNLVKPGAYDKVAVIGAGPIGLCALAACKALGVEEVVVSDISPLRLEVAKKLGASDVFDAREGSIVDFLYERHGGHVHPYLGMKVPDTDAIFECAGIPQTLVDACLGARHGGSVVILASHKPFQFDPTLLLTRELNLRGSWWTSPEEFAQAAGFLADGTLDLKPMISHRFALPDITAAFEMQAQVDKAVKVLVKPEL